MELEQDGCKIVINCGGDKHHGHHDKGCKPEYAEVISQVGQTLAASPGPNLAGQVVKLENTIKATPGIDVSSASVDGKVVINKAG